MQRYLYFICPTDHLETVIDKAFKAENYFFTSLGNSVTFDENVVEGILKLIETKGIAEITFVLSDNNQMLKDIINHHDLMNAIIADDYNAKVVWQEADSEVFLKTGQYPFSILSSFLNNKIKELNRELSNLGCNTIKIQGKIYTNQKHSFKDIYPDIMDMKRYRLN